MGKRILQVKRIPIDTRKPNARYVGITAHATPTLLTTIMHSLLTYHQVKGTYVNETGVVSLAEVV